MSKKFGCGDVVPGCSFVVTAESEKELMEAVAKHAAEAHGLKEVPAEVVQKVKAHIREA